PGERRFSTAGRCFATLASSSTWVAHGCGSRGTPRSCPSTRTRASAGHWTKCLPGNTQATARATSPGTRSCRRSGARILAACSSAMAARRGCAACDRLSRPPSPLRVAPRRLRRLRPVLAGLDRPRRAPDDRGGGRGRAGGDRCSRGETRRGRELIVSSEGGLLALIVDDEAATRVLAAWASGSYKLALAFEPETLDELAALADVY